jgi:hypothetical protein
MTRRGAAVAGALALAAGVGFNLPAHAENEACGPLQAAYVAHPEARTILLSQLQSFGCSIPTSSTSSSSTSSSSSSSSTSTSSSTTTTAPAGCAQLQQTYRTNPAAASTLLPLLQALGCSIPVTTTSSSTSSSSSSSSTSSSTSTTVGVNAACVSLLQTYNSTSVPAEARAQLLPILVALGCPVPGQSA